MILTGQATHTTENSKSLSTPSLLYSSANAISIVSIMSLSHLKQTGKNYALKTVKKRIIKHLIFT